MAAIRANEHDMAEFLIDNGVDYNFVATLFVSYSFFDSVARHRMYLRECKLYRLLDTSTCKYLGRSIIGISAPW